MAIRYPVGPGVTSVRSRILKRALEYIDETPFDGPEWCGAFALKVLHDCGYATGIHITSGGSGARLCQSLALTKSPLPGDIVAMKGHYAIFVGMTFVKGARGIMAVMTDSEVVTIDGGTFTDRVYMGRRRLHPATLFYSIEGLINGD